MWWRNLKISKKLLLGFGSIVVMFMVTVFVMRSYISVVEYSSNFLADRISKMLRLSTAYNNEAYDSFLSMRTVQYMENQDSINDYKEKWEKVKKTEDDIKALHNIYPELPGAKYAVEKVLPVAKQYEEHADKVLAQILKKQELLNKLSKTGSEITVHSEKLAANVHKQLKNSIGRLYVGADQAGAQNMADALILCAELMESFMTIRKETWHAINIVNAGGGFDEMMALKKMMEDIQNKAMDIKPLLSNTQEEGKELEELISDLKVYDDSLKNFTNLCFELAQLHNSRATVMLAFNNETNAANNLTVSRVEFVSKENVDNLNAVSSVMTISAIICVVFALIIALTLSRSISKPLNRIVSLAKRAGDGDLTIKSTDFGYEGRDEMGSMVSALADMVQSQSSTMTNIVKIAEDLAGGANNLSAISEETNASMEEIKASISQAKILSESNGAALEESNAGVEEMSAGADTVARSATDSAAFIAQTTDASNNAIDTVRNVISGMHDVDKNAKESEGKIQQLVLSVENVSSFVSVITGIADQTNLLALNAAIEAARAGEVGRGFAVVAEEVRKLAEESARAAQNVNGIIKELQTGAQESIKATTEAGHLLASTLEHAEEALKELNGAMDQINKANDSIQNIAAIAEEQAASSKEVAQAIDNATKASLNIIGTISGIHSATDETAKATEGVAKHAESMTEYSSTLSDLLSKFKLDARSANAKMLTGRV
ncbi:MAG: methyl-accepting chemotaxis protein [Oscillospiraceae bacterium]|jgi:methyl-accepting chemotaxis protein|nr:methyl-accepting chemotaxis protein [Oscillospiraceae bacterium]